MIYQKIILTDVEKGVKEGSMPQKNLVLERQVLQRIEDGF